jgi:hypothetical protein
MKNSMDNQKKEIPDESWREYTRHWVFLSSLKRHILEGMLKIPAKVINKNVLYSEQRKSVNKMIFDVLFRFLFEFDCPLNSWGKNNMFRT